MPYTKAFERMWNSLEDTYLYKGVPKEFQKRYGKRYGKKDIKSFAFAVAKSKGIKIDKK